MNGAKIVRSRERFEKRLYTGVGLARSLLDDVVRNEPDQAGEAARERIERFRQIGVVARMRRKIGQGGSCAEIAQRHDGMHFLDVSRRELSIRGEGPHSCRVAAHRRLAAHEIVEPLCESR